MMNPNSFLQLSFLSDSSSRLIFGALKLRFSLKIAPQSVLKSVGRIARDPFPLYYLLARPINGPGHGALKRASITECD